MATRIDGDNLYLGLQALDVANAVVAIALSFWLPDPWRAIALLHGGACIGEALERRRQRRRMIEIVGRAGLWR